MIGVPLESGLDEGVAIAVERPVGVRVYRVGAPLPEGPIWISDHECLLKSGKPVPTEVMPRRELVPLPPSDLVRFERRSAKLSSEFSALILRGSDGATFIETVERVPDSSCFWAGAHCISGDFVTAPYNRTRRFVDPDCTELAIHFETPHPPTVSAQGRLSLGMDECAEHHVLGTLGVEVPMPGYVRTAAGS